MRDRTCLQCEESEAAVKASQREQAPIYCAIADLFGECVEDWDRHRFADRPDRELDRLGILPEHREKYRRANEQDLDLIDCTHRGREHRREFPDDPLLCVVCFDYERGSDE